MRLSTRAVLRLAVLFFGFGLILPGVSAVQLHGELGMRYEENRTRAEAELDQRDDTAVVATANARELWRLDPLTRVSAEVGLEGRLWTRFQDTSRLAGSLGLRVKRLLDTDFKAPWIEGSASVTGLVHRDSRIRDGGVIRAGVTVGKRFGARMNARAGYAYNVRRATRDVVFDIEHHEAFGQLDWTIDNRWLLYADFRATEGELTSVATLPNPKIGAAAKHVSIDFDTSFERGPSPLGIGERPRWTYQLDGMTLSGELGVNVALKPGWALDVAARYVTADAAGDNQYNGYIVNGGLLWRF